MAVFRICRRRIKQPFKVHMAMRNLQAGLFPLAIAHVHRLQIRRLRPECLLEGWRVLITSIHPRCKASRRGTSPAGRACPLHVRTSKPTVTTLQRRVTWSLGHTATSRARGCERLMKLSWSCSILWLCTIPDPALSIPSLL